MESEDEFKEEFIDLLVGPIEHIAALFMQAFKEAGHRPKIDETDWSKGLITISFFERIPTSDMLRNIIFGLYDRQWGQKPGGIECVYRGLTNPSNPSWNSPVPVILYITTDSKQISNLLRDQRSCHVMDHRDYRQWKNNRGQARPARPMPRDSIVLKAATDTPILGREDVDPGEPVPVVRMGLFRI